MKLFIRFSFDGTAYYGYQVQGELPTVQRALNIAAKSLFGYECDIVGCSRTDAGVHARMFCATVSKRGESDLPTTLPPEKIPRAMCAYLPDDITVWDACVVNDEFHPRYGVLSKEYEYRFLIAPLRDPFEQHRSWHIPYPLLPDAQERMRMAASAFCGTHDFTSYMAKGSSITDAVRTVFSTSITREGNILSFRVRADGFLYHMVRIMAGTLIEVGLGKKDPTDIPKITAAKNRAVAGRTAPPQGLYLDTVDYDMNDFSYDI